MEAANKLTHRDPSSKHLLKVKELAEKEGVSEEIKKEIDRVIELIVARDEYCDNITSNASAELDHLIQDTVKHPWEKVMTEGKVQSRVTPVMMSGNHEAQFLKSITSMAKAKKVLEIGCFTGCGALSFAEALPDDGVVYSCEMLPYVAELARSFVDKSPHGNKIHIMTEWEKGRAMIGSCEKKPLHKQIKENCQHNNTTKQVDYTAIAGRLRNTILSNFSHQTGPAIETLKNLGDKKESFDIIFMDADKDNYSNYYKTVFELNLLAPGGTLVVDNALGHGYPYSHENPSNRTSGPAIEKFNEMVRAETDIHRVMVPMRDGVMLIRRQCDVTKR